MHKTFSAQLVINREEWIFSLKQAGNGEWETKLRLNCICVFFNDGDEQQQKKHQR